MVCSRTQRAAVWKHFYYLFASRALDICIQAISASHFAYLHHVFGTLQACDSDEGVPTHRPTTWTLPDMFANPDLLDTFRLLGFPVTCQMFGQRLLFWNALFGAPQGVASDAAPAPHIRARPRAHLHCPAVRAGRKSLCHLVGPWQGISCTQTD